MKTTLRVISIMLLLFNGIGAVYGSWHLVTDPSGGSLQMPLAWLQYSPFENYLIPGIILFLVNGVLSLTAASLVVFKVKFHPLAVMGEGCILFGWITVQVLMVRTIYFLHIIFWIVGVLLILSGWLLSRKKLVQ